MFNYRDTTPSDRLLIALVLASIVHAFVIFGISFDIPKPTKTNRSLNITLVNSANQRVPDEADYLAQENQTGGGVMKDDPTPKARPRAATQPAEAQKPTKRKSDSKRSNTKGKRVLTQDQSQQKVAAERKEDASAKKIKRKITVEELSRQIAQVGADMVRASENYSKRPKIMYINSVNAHKYKAASYERAWQEKVERLGNLNYPEEARRRNLSGGLLLSVGVNQDGTIHSIKIHKSSGHKALDDAAIRIVRLASPYAPFPNALKGEADILVITRTWKFFNNERIKTSR